LTYLERLRDLPLGKILEAGDKALDRMKRMPTIADLRELANEQGETAIYQQPRYQDFAPSGLVLEIREIGYGLAREMFGKSYETLDDLELLQVASKASRLRYERMGIKVTW
jgi:hypothetical protein